MKPEDLGELRTAEIKAAITAVLSQRTHESCSRGSLVKRVGSHRFGVKQLRGSRRESFAGRLNRIVAQLQRSGLVKQYVTPVGNLRIHLNSPS